VAGWATVERVESARAAFRALLEDDLNTAGGLGVVFDLVRSLNTAIDGGEVGQADLQPIRTAFEEFDRVLGVMALWRAEDADLPVPAAEIERLMAERQAAPKPGFPPGDRTEMIWPPEVLLRLGRRRDGSTSDYPSGSAPTLLDVGTGTTQGMMLAAQGSATQARP
jgi:hypothetical protein